EAGLVLAEERDPLRRAVIGLGIGQDGLNLGQLVAQARDLLLGILYRLAQRRDLGAPCGRLLALRLAVLLRSGGRSAALAVRLAAAGARQHALVAVEVVVELADGAVFGDPQLV